MTNPLQRLKAAVADRYAIEHELGQGGMATVYLAQDLKHDRKVAVKVLRPELGAVLGGERFLSEIRVTANLQHPHILALYDSGEAEGLLYYVMPYIEGESLRDLLKREKQLAVDEAIEVSRAVASALDYAHRHDVIHRDIKPENILMHDGQALVADFGIALAVSAAAGTRLTETGLSLGTPHYMSPEQATADRELDARSDIYSLACVTYEMLAGQPPYTAATAQAVVAKILTEEPAPITSHRKTVPLHVEAAIAQALSKLPADRFHDASTFAEALIKPGLATAASTTPSAAASRARRAPLWVWPALAGFGAVAAWGWLRPTPEPEPGVLARFTVQLPATEQIGNQGGRRVTISPDGRTVVYVGEGPDGRQLYERRLDADAGHRIAGTENASEPFFAPDSRSVAFNSLGGLYRISLTGGAPQRIATEGSQGGSWSEDGRIVYSPQTNSGLFIIPDTGGDPVPLTAPDNAAGELNHADPSWLPGGDVVLFTTWFREVDGSQIGVVDVNSGEIKYLAEGRSAKYVRTGHVIFTTIDGVMRAAPFDLGSQEFRGPANSIVSGIALEDAAAEYAISENGTLVYIPRAAAEQKKLVLVSRDGGERVLTSSQAFIGPRFSPDGRSVAVHLAAAEVAIFDVWTVDVATGDLRKFTLNGANFFPSWTPSGDYVHFASRSDDGAVDIYRKRADGAGGEEPLLAADGDQWEISWAPDGHQAVVRQNAPETGNRDLWLWTFDGDPVGEPIVATDASERSPAVSPDGRFFAYVSDVSGRSEIYVQPFPHGEGRWQISTEGGTEPVWGPDGRELFYRAGGVIMSVSLRTDPTLVVGRGTVAVNGMYVSNSTHTNYDVHPDGQRFVMVKVGDLDSQLGVIVNWFEALKGQVDRVD